MSNGAPLHDPHPPSTPTHWLKCPPPKICHPWDMGLVSPGAWRPSGLLEREWATPSWETCPELTLSQDHHRGHLTEKRQIGEAWSTFQVYSQTLLQTHRPGLQPTPSFTGSFKPMTGALTPSAHRSCVLSPSAIIEGTITTAGSCHLSWPSSSPWSVC